MVDFKKFMVVIYVIAAIGAIFLLSKMIGTINKTVKPDKIVYVKTDSQDLFSQPDDNSIGLISLNKGDKLIFLEETGEWYKVASGSFTGYIRKEHLSENPVKE